MWDSTEISMNLVTRAFYLGLEKTFTHTYIQNNIFQTIAKIMIRTGWDRV